MPRISGISLRPHEVIEDGGDAAAEHEAGYGGKEEGDEGDCAY